MISDWLVVKLFGELVVDLLNVGIIGMFDLFSCDWCLVLLDMVGLCVDMLLLVKEIGILLGVVIEVVVQQSGLCVGMLVVMGGGDVQFGCLGFGVVYVG